jgi:cytochrome c
MSTNVARKETGGGLLPAETVRRRDRLRSSGMRAFAPPAVVLLCLSTLSATPAWAEDGDPAKGRQVFARCQACHTVEAGANKLGPSLHGVVGRPAASVEGFAYSDAMKESGLIWDDATLDQYLTNPRKLVPGTKMIFPGLPNPQDRADVIAFLKESGGEGS